MQGPTIIKTYDVDELFISTVVRLIQRRVSEPPKYYRQNTFSRHCPLVSGFLLAKILLFE